MSEVIKKLSPNILWENFYKLTQIPRPSDHEEKARAFLLDWAKERNISARMDKAGNIIMKQSATPGMEDRKGVILQGHLDMVPQKNADKKHDFVTDPIDAYIDGDYVRANGTTLGADNGIGVATAMSILEDKEIAHGPLEVLITATEETSMVGANGLNKGELEGDILLNLDSETMSELYVGCAGGVDANITFQYEKEAVPAGFDGAYVITLNGLKGGHSGMDIHLGRGNSNILMAKFLSSQFLRIASFNGGNMKNAIPREATALVIAPDGTVLGQAVKAYQDEIRREYATVAPDLVFTVTPAPLPAFVMTLDLQNRLLDAIMACPNGVLKMMDSLPGTVETSNNLAIVDTEGDKIYVKMLLRSSVEGAKNMLQQNIAMLFESAGAGEIKFENGYPGWNPNEHSSILAQMSTIHKTLFGFEPKVMAVHAGLECGILGAKYPNLDMISFGPTILSPHSPDERVEIASVEKFWKYINEILKQIPIKG